MNMFESAKTIINNYYTYIINTTPDPVPVPLPETPAPACEDMSGCDTASPMNELSAAVRMDIENEKDETESDNEDIFEDQPDDAEDTTFPMEVVDDSAPHVTMFRGNRAKTLEDEMDEEDMLNAVSLTPFFGLVTEDDPRFRNVTFFRGGRGSPADDLMEIADDNASYRDTHPDSDEDDNVQEEEVIYIDISDSIDENTISTMRYDPNERGTIRGCLGCHYFVASSRCTYSGIRCRTCDCLMEYVL
jgi:hypothetical protein